MIGSSVTKNGIMLGLFAVVTTALIAWTWLGTQDKIDANEKAFRARALLEVVPEDRHNNSMLEDAFEVSDTELLALRKTKQGYIARQDGTPVAVIIPVTTREGYTGDIDLIVGINIDGTVSGVRILQHRETPGLGDKVEYRKSQWVDGFIGKSLFNPVPELWKVKKDKGVFDQFTGATITPRAVTQSVRQALEYFDIHREQILKSPEMPTMAETSYNELTRNGLWKNNAAIVQLLGLCPLLAVTGTVINAIGMALATTFVLVTSNACVSLIRNFAGDAIRLPAFVMIIASAVTCIEILMQAYSYELFQILGIFLPLITTNCLILGRAEAFASKNKLLPAMYDGLMMALGFSLVLILLGALREVVGTGAIFANMDLLFGAGAAEWKIVLNADYPQFLLAILPPGAFIFTGLIIALKNIVDTEIKRREELRNANVVKESRRVRVTGHIS